MVPAPPAPPTPSAAPAPASPAAPPFPARPPAVAASQPPPGYAYPPPAYAYPPPAYAYPPPAYAYPPPVAYAAPPPRPNRERKGMLVMPYLGVHSFQDSVDSGLDPGLRVGALVGGYVSNAWSLNGGFDLDLINPNSQATSAGIELSTQMVDLTFSPLFHLGNGKAEFVVGPRAGAWMEWVHESVFGMTADGTGEGWTLGVNMGIFGAVSPSVLLGGLLSLEDRELLHSCATITGTSEMCKSSGQSATILGLSFALLL
jgi:hypothetical protein